MTTCVKCNRKPAEFVNEGGLCTPCWWNWWFEDYTTLELERLTRENVFSAEERAAAQIVLKIRNLDDETRF